MTTKQELIKELDALQAKINALPDEKAGLWKPEEGESYWCTSSGYIVCDANTNAMIDKHRLAVGNYFKTEAQAEAHVTNPKIRQRLKELAGGYEFVHNAYNRYFYWWMHDTGRRRDSYTYSHKLASPIYFATDTNMSSIAKTIVEEFSEEAFNGYLQS